MNNFLIDTSVVVKWFAPEEGSEKAKILLDLVYKKDSQLILPNFAQLELINVLKTGKKFNHAQIDQAINNFYDLNPHFVEIERKHSVEISALMETTKIASYDAAFIILAQLWRTPVFTADYQHFEKSPHVIWLSEWNGKI